MDAVHVLSIRQGTGAGLVVAPGSTLSLTPGEAAVLSTAPVQRMARLRQTGLGYLTAPCSEHTRLVHCLGTSCWTAEIFRSLDSSGGPTARRLQAADADLGEPGASARIGRLLALVHDASLLPLGHTIKHQLGFTHRKTSVLPLLADCVARIRHEAPAAVGWYDGCLASHAASLNDDLRFTEWAVAAAHLAAGKTCAYDLAPADRAAFVRALPALWLIVDVVTGPLSADLFDYAGRDLPAVGIDFEVPGALLKSLRIAPWTPEGAEADAIRHFTGISQVPAVYRLSVDLASGNRVAESLYTAIESRFQIAQRVWFDAAKMIPDAMLDMALRRIDAKSGEVSSFCGPFEPAHLLQIGDDALLGLLAERERDDPSVEPIVPNLLLRRLYAPVCRIEAVDLPVQSRSAAAKLVDPAERNRLEAILRDVVGLRDAALCVSCVPPDAQFKPADVLVESDGNPPAVLEEVAGNREDLRPIAALRRRYADLWSATVLAPPAFDGERFAAICHEVLMNYLRSGAS